MWLARGLILALAFIWGGMTARASFDVRLPASSAELTQPTPDDAPSIPDGAEQQEDDEPPAVPPVAPGANLLPTVSNFRINTATFTENSHDVIDGCIDPGWHKLLRFDFLVHNIGKDDLVLRNLDAFSLLTVPSVGHDHVHLGRFNEYQLFDRGGQQVIESYKQAFCLFDNRRISPWARSTGQFSPEGCDSIQGISAGWGDLYPGRISCQFIAIDDVPDGDYALVVTTNALGILNETSYADNRTCVSLNIEGYSVTEMQAGFCQQLKGQLPVLQKPIMDILVPCEQQDVPGCMR
jgi:hypothetical protein